VIPNYAKIIAMIKESVIMAYVIVTPIGLENFVISQLVPKIAMAMAYVQIITFVFVMKGIKGRLVIRDMLLVMVKLSMEKLSVMKDILDLNVKVKNAIYLVEKENASMELVTVITAGRAPLAIFLRVQMNVAIMANV